MLLRPSVRSETVRLWLVVTFGLLLASLRVASSGAADQPVIPIRECFVTLGVGQYVTALGYQNDNAEAVTIPIGPDNRFSLPYSQDSGQPAVFAPGRVQSAFAVTGSGWLFWQLRGPDGVTRSVAGTGGAFGPACGAPTIAATLSASPNAAGWHHEPVSVQFACDGSGMPVTDCTAPVTVTAEGANQTINGTGHDAAGRSATTTASVSLDMTAPQVSIEAPLDNAIVENAQVTVTGAVSDALSGLAGVTCNGTPVTPTNRAIACVVDLSPGLNTITLAASDVAGNSASQSVTVSLNDTFTLHVDSPIDVPAGTLATLWAAAKGPDGQSRTYLWTQLSGPSVVSQGADTANLSFLTPNDDATLTFQLTVSNSLQTLTAQAEVHVQSLATALQMEAGAREGHDSTLSVTSMSLHNRALWRATDTQLTVTLGAPDATTLDPTFPDAPLRVHLDRFTDVQDVTTWFTYDATSQTVSLDSTHVVDFRALLSTANMMELHIVGRDSAAQTVALGVPFLYAPFQIQGTLTAPGGTPPGTLEQAVVYLEGGNRQHRAVTTAAADGTFTFDGVIGESYTLMVTAPGDLFGVGTVRFDTPTPPTVGTVSIALVEPPTESLAGGGGGAALSALTSVEGSAIGHPTLSPFAQDVLHIPQGTKTVRLSAHLSTGSTDEAFFFYYNEHGGHPCEVAAALSYEVHDSPYSYAFLIDGRPIASGSGSYCSTTLAGLQAQLLDLTLDVSAATAAQDVDVRLVATASGTVTDFGPLGSISAKATLDNQFTILSVEDLDGPGRVKRLSEVTPRGKTQVNKMIGIPFWTKATHNQWKMRIRFRPTDAEIQEVKVKVYARYVGGPSEDLAFLQPPTITAGLIELDSVGFDPNLSGLRPVWEAKARNAYLVVEVKAKTKIVGGEEEEDEIVTKTAMVGLDPARRRKGLVLAPLYDAGEIPGAIRYSQRESLNGNDGWGTADTYSFLETHPSLAFNDVSLEHGGDFVPDHQGSHKQGTSIDLRYLGPGGSTDPLNGSNVAARQTMWAAAKTNNAALTTMIAWIQANRAGMDALFDAGGMRLIYIDPAPWHANPLMRGTFDDGTPIVDPGTGNPIGAWTPHGSVVERTPHLDHFHAERFPITAGNP